MHRHGPAPNRLPPDRTLMPGELYCERAPLCLGTVLGSCVAVCLWDSQLRFGGMNHFLLPNRPSNGENSTKFGDVAVSRLVEAMRELGSSPRHLQAKLFGGANMFPNVQGKILMNVGARNAAAVKEELTKRKIAVVAEDVGGHCGRTIIFDTRNGAVRVKTVKGENVIY